MAGTFNTGGLNAPPKTIVNKFSVGGVTGIALGSANNYNKVTLSGALTANTYLEMLNVAGSGVLNVAYVYTVDTTSRTVGIKVVIDGVTIFDAISAALTTTTDGIMAVGVSIGGHIIFEPICYNSSLIIYIKSSISETNKIGVCYGYRTTS